MFCITTEVREYLNTLKSDQVRRLAIETGLNIHAVYRLKKASNLNANTATLILAYACGCRGREMESYKRKIDELKRKKH